jgi:hypothetical protein
LSPEFFYPRTAEEVQAFLGCRGIASLSEWQASGRIEGDDDDDNESACEVYSDYPDESGNTSEANTDDKPVRPMLLEDFVKLDRVSQMVKSTCCSRVDQPMLCQEVGKGEPPKLVPWTCTQGYCSRCELFKRGCEGPRPAEPCTHEQCQLCGVDKLRWRECPIYQASEIPVKALVWEEAERQGTDKEGSQNTQLELTEKVLPFYEVVRLLNDNLERCRRHYGHKEWIRIAKTIDTGWIDRDSLLIFTDFSASMVLRAKAALNSSVDGHAVLAIFVVCYGSRKVTTPAGEKTVNDCDVWYFFGDTKSKGKKNDHGLPQAYCRTLPVEART